MYEFGFKRNGDLVVKDLDTKEEQETVIQKDAIKPADYQAAVPIFLKLTRSLRVATGFNDNHGSSWQTT